MKTGEPKTRIERMKLASQQRREQEKLELRQAILSAAGALFLEQGYERFSLRQVAERIGYSPTTIYLYFANKDDLLFAVVDEGFERFGKHLHSAAVSTQDPWERLAALQQAYMSFGLQNPVYYQLMFMQRGDFLSSRREGEKQPRIASFQVLQQSVQQAIDAGVLQPGATESYSDVLWALTHGIVSLAISMPMFDPSRVQRLAEAGRELVARGLHR